MNTVKSAPAILLIITLLTGCATGYGALAGGGAVATLALIGAASSGTDGPAPLTAAGGGFLIGLLAGAVGGAVASAVTRGQERRTQEKFEMEQRHERDSASLDERLRRLEAERNPDAASTAPRRRAAGRDNDERAPAEVSAPSGVDLSPRAREYGAD